MNNARLILASISALCVLLMGVVNAAEQAAPRTISDITELFKQYQPNPKLVEELRAKAVAEPPAGLSGAALAQFLVDRAYAALEIGDSRRAIADLRRAVAIDGRRHQRTLANALTAGGNYIESVRINQSLLASGALPERKVLYATSIVQFHKQTGNRDEARAALRQLEDAYARVSRRSAETDKFAFHSRAMVLNMDGKWDEAETALRRATDAAKTDTDNPASRSSAQSAIVLEANAENVRDNREVSLAEFLTDRNRLDEAELILRTALKRILARQGPYHVRSALAIRAFAELLTAQGRYPEATIVARAAVVSYETGGAVPEARGLASARRALAGSLVLESRWSEALTVFEQMQNGLAADPGSLTVYGRGDAYWGLALLKSNRARDAVSLLAPRVEQDRKVLGEAHPRLALMRGVLGMALAGIGERRRALSEFQAATIAMLAAGFERTAAEVQLIRHILDGYIGLLLEIRGTPFEREANIDATSEAFRLADLTRGQSVQGALASVAARASAADPAIAALARKEQDLGNLMQALNGYLLNHVSLRPEEQSPNVIAELQKRVEQMRAERRQVRDELQKRFPRYADLVNPRPATLDQARAALREGEVLLSVLTTADRSYVWAVPKQGPVGFHAVDLGALVLERIVSGLRRSLDPGEVVIDRLPEFDVAQAARLYESLLKPVEGSWAGAKTLLVVASGPLAQLPFGVLPTTAAAAVAASGLRFASYGAVPWLIKQLAIGQLPAVNTLVTLRALPAASPQRTAFVGFGDPQFGAPASSSAAADTTTVATRNLGISRVTETNLRAGSAPSEYIAYSALPPLPDTREEILAIAAALGADANKDVFLGASATKENVKKIDLHSRRIVAFATHGLIPGDFPNLDQPALALASPDGKAETGLLTLEDILGLKLDADWVVLSACNTGAGDGAGAEAISGLGRGFFFAGSRALLVTHWPVETRSARQLVTTLFERYAGNPTLSRAEALKQASLSVMDDSAKDGSGKVIFSYAHPLFWAPYALVGDGGR